MVGKKILHYEIQEKIGEGGMGAVYRARDTRLGRDVALKFLPPSLEADREARMRLLREAQAASRLMHTGIVAIHAIEEADEQDFIVMEYVAGRTLDRVIDEDDLSVGTAVELATQIADALAVADGEGVVHRDIKSSNIMVTDRGQAKILDFGLATFHGATQVTDAGSTLGTVAYMSPEQTEGAAVDRRSDIFSFGVVLYEMVAGRRPFSGDTRVAVAQAILNATPEPLARYKSGVPDALQYIVDKALRKDPAERYQSAADMAADLRTLRREMTTTSGAVGSTSSARHMGPLVAPKRSVGRIAAVAVAASALVLITIWFLGRGASPEATGEPADERIMLAVLPFENLGAADDEYFADGIAEEITARLARVDGLGVIARTSVTQYKGTAKSVQEVGAELGVEYLLEGTVRWQRGQAGVSRVRVTPQLVRVSDGTQIWADVYDAPMKEVFQVQTDIARGVVEELGVALLEPQRDEMARAPTENIEAYDFYLRARNKLNEGGYDGPTFRIAGQLLERAVELDPSFVEGYAELSRLYSDEYWFHIDRSEERVQMAKRTAEQALVLDSGSPDAHAAMGWYYYHGRSNYAQALAEFETALARRPNDASLISAIAFVQRRQGKFTEALANLEKAYRLDPRSSELGFSVAETLGLLRRFDEAIETAEATIEKFPGHEAIRTSLAQFHLYARGDVDAARAVLIEVRKMNRTNSVYYLQWHTEMCARDYDAALEKLADAAGAPLDDQFVYLSTALCYALTYRAMGRPDDAREHFERALEGLLPLVNAHPDEPRYRSSLGVVYAGLGKRDDAVREGERGRELQPLAADAMKAPFRIYEMATIFLLIGENELAIDELHDLMKLYSDYHPGVLRMEPIWDPLRKNPRFAALVERNT